MSIKKFKFVSPGVFIDEIDNSQLPATYDKLGPVVIGRSQRGPAMQPVRVDSFSEFIEVFGNPTPGGQGGDVWRDGNNTSATYGTYAAQAWLRNSGPCTYVRILGIEDPNKNDDGKAGWKMPNIGSDASKNGGAYGLFIFPSASSPSIPVTGVLAATWYLEKGGIYLSGTLRDGTESATGSAGLFINEGAGSTAEAVDFRVLIDGKDAKPNDGGSAVKKNISFNFNRMSNRYIRKVFNTNPTLLSSATSTTPETYFLGETYEAAVSSLSASSNYYAAILGLMSSSVEQHHHQRPSTASETGWIFSQDLSNNPTDYDADDLQKLFRLKSLDTGEWDQKNLKISIQDISPSTNQDDSYGTFAVVIRKAQDQDAAPQVVERFSGCNLNPSSVNYISRKIGDRYREWDSAEQRHKVYGSYDNRSKFIRVVINSSVGSATASPVLLPFGFYGPNQFITKIATSGSEQQDNTFAMGGPGIYRSLAPSGHWINVGGGDFTGHVTFPVMSLRVSSSDGNIPSPTEAYFGIDTTRNSTNRFEDSYIDLVRSLPVGLEAHTLSASFIFTLDDLSGSGTEESSIWPKADWEEGNRKKDKSISAKGPDQWKSVLSSGFDRFTLPLVGGFEGFDIKESDPLRNTLLKDKNSINNYAYASVKRAIDTVRDAESVEYSLATAPGLTEPSLVEHLISTCESRGDALALVDLKGDFVPSTENKSDFKARVGNVDTTVSNLRARGINSSYGAAYYPWVQIRDDISNSLIWVPPTIPALGVLANAERTSELWFAPAGFTRGGLTDGAAGLPVVSVSQRLSAKERDKLYSANINPIAVFPAEGIVIFGQKTLQVTPSALDRINVRRLLIYIKKEISRMAATTLFEQNVQRTWNNFLGRAEPFLRSVQVRLGLSDYKIILDETTTTPDLIDRNIMYAKIFLKPVQAIEFIALDFVVTDSGAAFED